MSLKSQTLCGQEPSFAPKTGGGCEVPSCPGPESSLETPRTVGSIRLPCRDTPPRWPVALATHYVCEVLWESSVSRCAVCFAQRQLCENSRTFSTNFRAEERQEVGKEAQSSHYHRPGGRAEESPGTQGKSCHRRPVTDCKKPRQGWRCGSVERVLSRHARKPRFPSTQPLGSGRRGATWTLVICPQSTFSHPQGD